MAKVHRDIRRRRQDFQWKLGLRIAAKADVIVFEDLKIQNMKRRCKPKKCTETGKYLRNNQKAKSQLNKAISPEICIPPNFEADSGKEYGVQVVELATPKGTKQSNSRNE